MSVIVNQSSNIHLLKKNFSPLLHPGTLEGTKSTGACSTDGALDTLHTFHCTPCTAHLALHTLHCTHYTAYLTLHTLHCTPYTAHLTVHTLHFTPYTAHLTLHTFYCTPYTEHLTDHILHNRSSHLGIHKQTNACWSIPRSQTVFYHFKICRTWEL